MKKKPIDLSIFVRVTFYKFYKACMNFAKQVCTSTCEFHVEILRHFYQFIFRLKSCLYVENLNTTKRLNNIKFLVDFIQK